MSIDNEMMTSTRIDLQAMIPKIIITETTTKKDRLGPVITRAGSILKGMIEMAMDPLSMEEKMLETRVIREIRGIGMKGIIIGEEMTSMQIVEGCINFGYFSLSK